MHSCAISSPATATSMRLSDIKALIAVLFVAIMMGTVLQYRSHYPWYLSAPVILAPFMIIYLNLLISVYPRFPRVRATALPDLAQSRSAGFQFHRRHRGRARRAPRAMRDSIADPLVEEHHLPDRRFYRDGLPCGGRGLAVRRDGF